MIRALLLLFALSCHAYTTTHPGALHQIYAIRQPGGFITIEDGSEWVAAPAHWETLQNWTAGDTLYLTPNRPWFSQYFEFKLENERTGERILVNWCKMPRKSSPFSRTILRRYTYELILDDQTRWRIRAGDRPTTAGWEKGDPVIIGTNDGFFSWNNPNILINMRDSSYVRCACMPSPRD